MQQGIGRTGYLLLALGALTFGLFGLVLAWTAYGAGAQLFFEMGAGVAALGLLVLFLFAATSHRVETTPPVQTTNEPQAPRPAPRRGDSFEFNDYTPAPKAAPENLVLPPAFADERPPAPQSHAAHSAAGSPARTAPVQFQQAKPAGDWPRRRTGTPRVAPEPEEPNHRRELTRRYTETTPMVRQILAEPEPETQVPEQVADRAPRDMNTDFVAPGMSVGRCGQCKTLVLAPERRPLRLKCPECAKVTLLE